jgi:hypothetical protein
MRIMAATLILACCLASPGHAQQTSDSYGLHQIHLNAAQKVDAARSGGFPNSSRFNDATRCTAVTALFSSPGTAGATPAMRDFLIYSRVRLMEHDVMWPKGHPGEGSIADVVGAENWKMLPVLFPSFCRSHPDSTMQTAAAAVYLAIRRSTPAQSG